VAAQVEKNGEKNLPEVWSWPCVFRQLGAKAPSPPRAHSELKCSSHLYPFEWAGVDIRLFSVDGFDTRWIPGSSSCGIARCIVPDMPDVLFEILPDDVFDTAWSCWMPLPSPTLDTAKLTLDSNVAVSCANAPRHTPDLCSYLPATPRCQTLSPKWSRKGGDST